MAKNVLPEQIGNYKITKELGRGSMGTVYLGTQESLGREVAIKVLAPEFTRDDEFLERFKREARAAVLLRHPNIVQVIDLGEGDGWYYIVMEYLGPMDLKRVLQERGGKLPLRQALAYGEQLLSALEHAHSKGIIHRDVKPANILINEQGQAVLTDFSVAQMKFASRLTQTGAAIGTPEYMAPEQYEGKGIDIRVDLYATGIILYEMVTGIQPFHGETVTEVMRAQLFTTPPDINTHDATLPEPLSRLIHKSLEKDRNLRYSTATEMLDDLRQLSGDPSGNSEPEAYLDQFLAAVAGGRISLDDANLAREKVKSAIDQGYRKNLTIMMVDLAGSSKIKIPSETLQADRAFRDYRSTINDLLKKHAVMSFDWSGDGAICIFELPLPAMRAAVEIQSQVGGIAERHPDLPSGLRARIGINTGEVYLDPRRGLGEFASRTVDQAGHLEKDCPVGSILVSQTTMDACRGEFQFESQGTNRDNIQVYSFKAEVAPTPPSPAPVEKVTPSPKLAEAQAPRFCPGCAQPVVPGHRHCSNCGFEVGSLTGRQNQTPPKEKEKEAPAPPKEPAIQAEREAPKLIAKVLNSPPATDKESDPAQSTKKEELLDVARRIVGISGIACYFLAVIAGSKAGHHRELSLTHSAMLVGGAFGVPCLTLASLAILVGYVIFVRKPRELFRAALIFMGLCVASVSLFYMLEELWRVN